MDVLSTHRTIVAAYREYIGSFINIADQRVRQQVENELAQGRLWPEPLLQFNPAFESGGTIEHVVADGKLNAGLPSAFAGMRLATTPPAEANEFALSVEFPDPIIRGTVRTTGNTFSLTYTDIPTNYNYVVRPMNFTEFTYTFRRVSP